MEDLSVSPSNSNFQINKCLTKNSPISFHFQPCPECAGHIILNITLKQGLLPYCYVTKCSSLKQHFFFHGMWVGNPGTLSWGLCVNHSKRVKLGLLPSFRWSLAEFSYSCWPEDITTLLASGWWCPSASCHRGLPAHLIKACS